MGFSAYRKFQHYLHELSIAQATPLDLMKMTSTDDLGYSGSPARGRWTGIRRTCSFCARDSTFNKIVELAKKLYEARRILVMGGDLARNLAGFLHYNLMLLGLPVFTAFEPRRSSPHDAHGQQG